MYLTFAHCMSYIMVALHKTNNFLTILCNEIDLSYPEANIFGFLIINIYPV